MFEIKREICPGDLNLSKYSAGPVYRAYDGSDMVRPMVNVINHEAVCLVVAVMNKEATFVVTPQLVGWIWLSELT